MRAIYLLAAGVHGATVGGSIYIGRWDIAVLTLVCTVATRMILASIIAPYQPGDE